MVNSTVNCLGFAAAVMIVMCVATPQVSANAAKHRPRSVKELVLDHPSLTMKHTALLLNLKSSDDPINYFKVTEEAIQLANELFCAFKVYSNKYTNTNYDEAALCEHIPSDVIQLMADAESFYKVIEKIFNLDQH